VDKPYFGYRRSYIFFLKKNEKNAGNGNSGYNWRWWLSLLKGSQYLSIPPPTVENLCSR
jgi:hypothetical protein